MFTFPDRSKSLLSGEEIINFKQNSLKDIPAGIKDYAPDNSWLEQKQIQAALETHHALVSAQRIEKKSNLSTAQWLSNVGKAKVTKKAGKHWEVFGHSINSEDWLLPEEALFLLETNALELYLDEVPLSIEQTYSLIIDDCISLSEYRVYSHLSRKGFRVLRHDKEISVTPYEKDIHADQVSLAAKRSAPCSSTQQKPDFNRDKPPLVVSEGVPVDRISPKNVVSDANCHAEGSGSSNDVEVISSISPKHTVDVVASTSKDVHVTEASGSSNDIPGPVDSNVAPIILVSDSSDYTDSTHKGSVKNDVLHSGSSEKSSRTTLSVPDSSTHDDSSCSKPESELRSLVVNGKTSSANVQELISLESGDDSIPDCNVVIEMPDDSVGESSKAANGNLQESMNLDDSSTEDPFPRPPSSSELMIVETVDQVIEIYDDEPSSEDEIMIMDVRKPNIDIDTVNLLDSDEDDDVVYICQKPKNLDPSKWRKWFLSTSQFVNFKFKENPEDSKIPKVKLIDLFDLGQKSFDAIWKAIPKHDSNDEFMNAPDQRFIPSTILPKFAQYRINLHKGATSPRSERQSPGNVDTSQGLNEIVQYGREPSYFNRNDGYSFHRSRNHNQSSSWFNSNATRPPRNQMFGESQQNPRFNSGFQGIGFCGLPEANDQQQISNGNQNHTRNRFGNHNQHRSFGNFNNQIMQNNDQLPPHQHSNGNQNYNRNRFHNQHRHFGNFDSQTSAQRPNFQPQGSFAPNQFGNFPNQFGGVHNEGLKMAVVQACQMQMLAVGLMQSCQALMQQVPGLMNNMNMNNMFPVNNLLGGGLVQQPHQSYPYNRGHRPYRRPWRGQVRRRYYNEDRSEGPRVTEIPTNPPRDNREKENSNIVSIVSDDEDKKVKPAIKRNIALGAIASLNKPKRAKLKITTEVKSIKIDSSEPSTSSIIDLDDVSSVKSESPRASPRLQETCKRSEKRVTDVSPLAKAVVTPSGTPESQLAGTSFRSDESVPVDPKQSVAHAQPKRSHPEDNTIVIISDESRPSYMVYDEQVSVDSDSVGFVSEFPDAAAVDSCSQPEAMEAANSVDAVSVPETLKESDSRPNPLENTEDLPGSWKTYKEQEQSFGEYQHGRSSIEDAMKSLQVIGPIDDTEYPRDELRVLYDVYLPNQAFRKSVRLLPNYRVIVAKSQCFPTVQELNYLESLYPDNVPFLYAVVTLDTIRLYNLRCVSLPTLVPDV